MFKVKLLDQVVYEKDYMRVDSNLVTTLIWLQVLYKSGLEFGCFINTVF